jgi:hypothetical protein
MPIVLGRKPGGAGSGPGGGVTSVNAVGDPALTGAVTLSEGDGITLTQAGQDIEVAVSAIVWTTFTAAGIYTNGAADFGAPYGAPAYAVDDINGLVYLRGLVNPGTDGAFATLPVAARPSAQRFVTCAQDAGQQGMDILTSGVMDAFSNPTSTIGLDGLYFSL